MEQAIAPREVLLRAFPGLDNAQADEIIASGLVQDVPGGINLCTEGEYEDIFYIILKGKVRVTKQIHNDTERTLNTLGPGSFFGEMAIIHDAPRVATVTTIESSSILSIHKDAFTGLLETSNSVSLAIIREVSRRLRENDEMAIEDLRLKAKELAEAYQQLAEEEFARSQFLTMVAHELRTPLMAANGYLQAIRMGMFQGDAATNALDTVWRNLQEITSLTNDILFLQEMNLILPEFHPTDVLAVVRAAIEQERDLARRQNVVVSLSAPEAVSSIPGDPKSLQRALAAILDNAIKFSPDGGEVEIKVIENHTPALTTEAGDIMSPAYGEIRIVIIDHGVGIPSESMHRIFNRFFHLDIICGKVFRGIGLGLSIAKHVIEQHQGTIEVQSELGVGSVFTVRLSVRG